MPSLLFYVELSIYAHMYILCTHISILYAPEECRAQRKNQESKSDFDPQQTESMNKIVWQAEWEEENPKLLLYSCIYGTVEIVKYFIAKGVSPTTRYFLYTLLAYCINFALIIRGPKNTYVWP